MKPFNLERALAGDKVVTRDGREVTQLFMLKLHPTNALVGVVNGKSFFWPCSGTYLESGQTGPLDLFMAPKTVKRWVNFYPDYSGALDYPTIEQAKAHFSHGAIAIAVPVEFEEGYGCNE